MTLLSITLSCVLGWCARIVYCDLRRWLHDRETDRVVLAFFQADERNEERVASGVREMMR